MTTTDQREANALLTTDLAEESEQVQALARALDLPQRTDDPALLLSRNLVNILVHLATAAASAAAVVDAGEPPNPAYRTALARIESALQSLVSATGSLSTVLDQLAAPNSPVTDTAGLAQAGRLRAAALLTSAAAHLGAASATLSQTSRS
ncbi:hypothetical protein ACWC5I_18135 [Kitasatospora sp. NPDC001574]